MIYLENNPGIAWWFFCITDFKKGGAQMQKSE